MVESDFELDLIIADKVMGLDWVRKVRWDRINRLCIDAPPDIWKGNCPYINEALPSYSSDIKAAWEVVERLLELGFHWWMAYVCEEETRSPGAPLGSPKIGAHVRFEAHARTFADGYAGSMPEAICLAALKAVGVEVPQ